MRTQDYWRRSRRSLRGFALEKYYPNVPTNGELSAENIIYNAEGTAGLLVQVDGQLQYSSDAQTLKEKGIYFAHLPTALQEQPELFRDYFMTKGATLETTAEKVEILRDITNLTRSTVPSGKAVICYMSPKGVKVELPLRVYIRMSEAAHADLSHTLIIAEEGSEVAILEDNSSTNPEASGLHSGAIEIFAGQNANVTLCASPRLESTGLEFRYTPCYSRQRCTTLLGHCYIWQQT